MMSPSAALARAKARPVALLLVPLTTFQVVMASSPLYAAVARRGAAPLTNSHGGHALTDGVLAPSHLSGLLFVWCRSPRGRDPRCSRLACPRAWRTADRPPLAELSRPPPTQPIMH